MPLVSPGSGTHTPDSKDVGGGASAEASGAEQDRGGPCAASAATEDLEGLPVGGRAKGPPRASGAVPHGDVVNTWMPWLVACGAWSRRASWRAVLSRGALPQVTPLADRPQPATGVPDCWQRSLRVAPVAVPASLAGNSAPLVVDRAIGQGITGAHAARQGGDEESQQVESEAAAASLGAARAGSSAGIFGHVIPRVPLADTRPPTPPAGRGPTPAALLRAS